MELGHIITRRLQESNRVHSHEVWTSQALFYDDNSPLFCSLILPTLPSGCSRPSADVIDYRYYLQYSTFCSFGKWTARAPPKSNSSERQYTLTRVSPCISTHLLSGFEGILACTSARVESRRFTAGAGVSFTLRFGVGLILLCPTAQGR